MAVLEFANQAAGEDDWWKAKGDWRLEYIGYYSSGVRT